MNDIIKQHHDMVLRLCKPGDAILASLNAEDCYLVHIAPCLGGEASELYDFVVDPDEMPAGDVTENELEEELGDFYFYLVALFDIFEIDRNPENIHHTQLSPEEHYVALMHIGGHLWDVVKRIVIYRKDRNTPDKKYDGKTLKSVGQGLLKQAEAHYHSVLRYYGLSAERVAAANYRKLADADTGRYASGSYSDQQAVDRRDESR